MVAKIQAFSQLCSSRVFVYGRSGYYLYINVCAIQFALWQKRARCKTIDTSGKVTFNFCVWFIKRGSKLLYIYTNRHDFKFVSDKSSQLCMLFDHLFLAKYWIFLFRHERSIRYKYSRSTRLISMTADALAPCNARTPGIMLSGINDRARHYKSTLIYACWG